MVDLIIPAALRIWLVFLFVFFLLGYPAAFSILFGAIGGIAGGITTAWWQVKGNGPSKGKKKDKDKAGSDNERLPANRADGMAGWEIPFFGPNKAKQRYLERNKRARDRRMP